MNQKTNLGMLVLLTATFAFGVAAVFGILGQGSAMTNGSAFRVGVAAGIAASGALAMVTYSVLVIRKANKKPVAA